MKVMLNKGSQALKGAYWVNPSMRSSKRDNLCSKMFRIVAILGVGGGRVGGGTRDFWEAGAVLFPVHMAIFMKTHQAQFSV